MKCENALPLTVGSNLGQCKHCRKFYLVDQETPECGPKVCVIGSKTIDEIEQQQQAKDDQRFVDQAAIAIASGMSNDRAYGSPHSLMAMKAWDMADELLKERKKRMEGNNV